MKRRTKIGLAIATAGFGAIALSGCTASFCSNVDLTRMKYAFEPGITRLAKGEETDQIIFKGANYNYTITGAKLEMATWQPDANDVHVGKYYFDYGVEGKQKELTYLNTIIKNARDTGVKTVDDSAREYFKRFDYLAFNAIFGKAADDAGQNVSLKYSAATETEEIKIEKAKIERDLSYYSYLRFCDLNNNAEGNFNKFDTQAREEVKASSVLYGYTDDHSELSPDFCPSSDFIKMYKLQLNSYVAVYRNCLTTKTDKYGSYGYEASGVFISEKTWGDAWNKGFFEGLLVYPIGWLVDNITMGFRGVGATAGLAAFLGIVIVTFIIRGIMLLATWKQTQSNAKMTELQPEITKIQNKYPNSNTSKAEKARMAQEMQALYKKNHVNPFITLIVLVVQFPVFICVWGALSGSAILTDGTFLGLTLSVTIKDALFNSANWTAAGGYAAVTALFLFLFMAGAQTVSMLLPQWIQKKKAKEIAKLGKNPAQKQQSNRMKWFTYIMLALIIFMGFSLASAMGIYWFVGAVFSIVQTLIIQVVTDRKAKRK